VGEHDCERLSRGAAARVCRLGSADVGFATSTNGGVTWAHGNLPGLTVNYKGGTYGAAADPSVAYDAKHGQWLISTLPLVGLGPGSRFIGDVA